LASVAELVRAVGAMAMTTPISTEMATTTPDAAIPTRAATM
jgi:hypothetical protein